MNIKTEKYEITIPVVKTFILKMDIILIVLICINFCIMINIRDEKIPTQQPYHLYFQISTVFEFVLVLIFGIRRYFVKTYKTIGRLTLSKGKVVLKLDNNEEKTFKNISSLNFSISSYFGQGRFNASGTSNYFIFREGKKRIRHNLYIKDIKTMRLLKEYTKT